MPSLRSTYWCPARMATSNNTMNNNLITVMPEEVLEHIAGLIEGPASRAMCNAFGKTSEQYASFQCGGCKRWQPLTALDSDLHGLAVAEDDFRAVYHKFCIDEEECQKVQRPRRIMTKGERLLITLCVINDANWN